MTTTQVTHTVERCTVYLGGAAKTIVYRIVDNLGRLVGWEGDKDTATALAESLSQPRVDE